MNLQGYIIVYGSLGLVIACVIAGLAIKTIIGSILLFVGIAGLITWFVLALYIANAMNTDI
jgi:hypothetical protein